MMISTHRAPIRTPNSGIALLVAIIFMSVVLAIGLTLSSLGYKQVLISSSVVASQNAFYAADAALECVLYADQQQGAFLNSPGFHTPATSITCDNKSVSVSAPQRVYNSANTASWDRYTLGKISLGNGCAKVIVYKPYSSTGTTYLFASGYDNPTCSVNERTTVRGLDMHYTTL